MTLLDISGDGRLGADPVLRFTKSGLAILSLRMVFADTKLENGEWVDQGTTWVNVTYSKSDSEQMNELLVKGDRVFVSGKLIENNWKTTAGEDRRELAIRAAVISKRPRSNQTQSKTPAPDIWAATPNEATDAPF
jgi:single stranded DNA-binding protein